MLKNDVTNAKKFPEINKVFWILKILATIAGESGASALVKDASLGFSGALAIVIPIVAFLMFTQLSLPKHDPILFWFLFAFLCVMGSVVTRLFQDALNVTVWPEFLYVLFLVILVMSYWYGRTGNLDISQGTGHVELYVWMTLRLMAVLGPTLGDLVAQEWQLGYWQITGAILAILIVMSVFRILRIVPRILEIYFFWSLYVITQVGGAVLADAIGEPSKKDLNGAEVGGLGFTPHNTCVLATAFFFTVLAIKHPLFNAANRYTPDNYEGETGNNYSEKNGSATSSAPHAQLEYDEEQQEASTMNTMHVNAAATSVEPSKKRESKSMFASWRKFDEVPTQEVVKSTTTAANTSTTISDNNTTTIMDHKEDEEEVEIPLRNQKKSPIVPPPVPSMPPNLLESIEETA